MNPVRENSEVVIMAMFCPLRKVLAEPSSLEVDGFRWGNDVYLNLGEHGIIVECEKLSRQETPNSVGE